MLDFTVTIDAEGFGGMAGNPTPEGRDMPEAFVRFVDKYLG